MSAFDPKLYTTSYYDSEFKGKINKIFEGFLIWMCYGGSPTLADLVTNSQSIADNNVVLPVWFNQHQTNNGLIINFRFYVPLQHTTNNPSGFAILACNEPRKSFDSLSDFVPIFVSQANQAENTSDLIYNQGRFNRGWNSISVELNGCKCLFAQIEDFSSYSFSTIADGIAINEGRKLNNLLKNKSIRAIASTSASRLDILKQVNEYEQLNLEGTFGLNKGIPTQIMSISEGKICPNKTRAYFRTGYGDYVKG